MKTTFLKLIFLLFFCQIASAQQVSDTPILKAILANFYKTEKPIYKGRNQLLYFYCEKSNNNEEIFETINGMNLPPAVAKQIRHYVTTDLVPENWAKELEEIYTTDKTNLNIKINACLSLEEYQAKQKRFNLNNQRLMIVSKPIFYSDNKHVLVKVVFYRSIEHNNGSVLLLENVNGDWVIKDFLNAWST